MNNATLEVVSAVDATQSVLTKFKESLDPFILTDWKGLLTNWDSLNCWRTILNDLDENSGVECSITTESVEQQVYLGSEAASMPRRSKVDEESVSPEYSSVFLLFGQESCGVDIMDDVEYRKRCLSRLRLSLLQRCNLYNPDVSTDGVSSIAVPIVKKENLFDGVKSKTENSKHLLFREDVIVLLSHRKFLPSDSGLVIGAGETENGEVEKSLQHPPLHPLGTVSGSLCFKVNIGLDTPLMSKLKGVHFDASDTPFASVDNPLLLQNYRYCAWAVLSECGSGTRCHTNVMGSHSWHILVRGRKKWRIAHPLDKYLLSHEEDGATANLWATDLQKFPLSHFARIYEVIQHPGESLFIPSDAVYSDIAEEDSWGFQINFVDKSCYPMFEYQTNYNLMLLSSLKFDYGYLQQFTIVDVMIRAPLPENLPELVIRGAVWCSDTSALLTELGARVELAAIHECFESIGKYLLDFLREPHYSVGLPKGLYLCESEHRVVLHYESPLETYKLLEEALQYLTTDEELDFRFFRAPSKPCPTHHSFPRTISQEGSLLSYIPLSVLLNQPWPFEERLIKTCIALPQVILEKAKHPQGFVRPGSVWHYSNKGINVCSIAEEYDTAISMHKEENTISAKGSPPLLEESFLNERNSALFYCSPLLRIPITLHPQNDSPSQKEGQIGKNIPRIHEFAWDVGILEKYGRVELLQFRHPVVVVMKNEVCSDPQFENLKSFLIKHGLVLVNKEDTLNSESLIAAILWILCSPCVTGFTCPAGVQSDSGEFISSSDMYQFQMIGLPSRAAFALLKHVYHSSYGLLTTCLCNWICDINSPGDDLLVLKLFINIKSHCDVEVGEILDQIRRVKDSLLKSSSGSQVNSQKLEFLSQFIRSFSEGERNAE